MNGDGDTKWQRKIIEPDNPKLNASRAFNLPHSPGVQAGPLFYLSGMISLDPETGELKLGTVASETRQILENMSHLLVSNGTSLDRVVKVNVFIHDMLELENVNRVFRDFFPDDPPARTTCGVQLSLGAKVEIECVALAAA